MSDAVHPTDGATSELTVRMMEAVAPRLRVMAITQRPTVANLTFADLNRLRQAATGTIFYDVSTNTPSTVRKAMQPGFWIFVVGLATTLLGIIAIASAVLLGAEREVALSGMVFGAGLAISSLAVLYGRDQDARRTR